MNYTGKIDSISVDGLGVQARSHVETITKHGGHAPADAIIVPDAQLLFNGDFKRSGLDLIVSKDGHDLLLQDYFKGDKRAPLSSPDGAHLTGDLVSALTGGHTQFAQAGGGASVGKVIGHVSKLTGTATATRNGVSIILNNGDNVEKGDVVQSGSDSTLGITFIDGTVFGLSSNARMVLNEMVYDPNGSNNSSLLSLVAGTISFVAGETAKHGDMKVDTPVATMGIRGTAVLAEIEFQVPSVVPDPNPPPPPRAKFHVLVEPDGTTGSYILFEKNTLIPLATVNQAGQQVSISQGLVSITTAPLSPEVQRLITDVFSIKFTDNVNPKVQFALGSSGNSLADILGTTKTAGDTPFDLQMPGIGKGTTSTASLIDSSAEMLFFPRFAINGSTLVEDSVAGDLNLSNSGTVVFTDGNAGGALGATFALKSSTSSAQLPGFSDNVTQIGTFGLGGVFANVAVSVAVDWTFTIPDSDPVLQSLAMGQTVTQVYTITLSNGVSQDVVVTLLGTNDIPTIVSSTGDAPVLTEDSVATNLSSVGTITFKDVDLIDTHNAGFALKSSTSSAHLPGFTDNISQIGTFALTSGSSGVAEINTDTGNTATVGWSFTLADDNPVLQSLAKGQTITQVYTVTITDNNDAQVTRDVTITLVGTNDAPIITSEDVVGAVTEQVAPGGNLTDSGLITFTELDLTDVHVISPTITASAGALGTLTASVTSDTTGIGLGGVITWNYTVADSAVEYLAKDQTRIESFTITLSDQNGGVITRHIDVTITGTNDAPVVAATDVTGAVTEQGTPGGYLSDTGTIAFSDVDLTDVHLVSPTGMPIGSVLGSLTAVKSHDTTGTGTGGQLTWTYTVADSAFKYLAAGQTSVESFTITLSDQNGGVIVRQIDVTITGTNDGPVAVADSASGTENQTLTINVLANDTDVDDGHVFTLNT
ncbi:MAG: VCBS domain-containing protein, partial [Bradyrhizobium sp.]